MVEETRGIEQTLLVRGPRGVCGLSYSLTESSVVQLSDHRLQNSEINNIARFGTSFMVYISLAPDSFRICGS